MPRVYVPKELKLKKGDVRDRARGGLAALVWKDRREVDMLTNMEPPLAKGNFCDDSIRPVKPQIVERTGTGITSTILIVWPTAIR
jgi:hypothetical protein